MIYNFVSLLKKYCSTNHIWIKLFDGLVKLKSISEGWRLVDGGCISNNNNNILIIKRAILMIITQTGIIEQKKKNNFQIVLIFGR